MNAIEFIYFLGAIIGSISGCVIGWINFGLLGAIIGFFGGLTFGVVVGFLLLLFITILFWFLEKLEKKK